VGDVYFGCAADDGRGDLWRQDFTSAGDRLEQLSVPHGSARDAARSLLLEAGELTPRARLGDRVEVWCQDVLDLDLEEPLDAIVSTATVHWRGR
jgi:hypothetical protein